MMEQGKPGDMSAMDWTLEMALEHAAKLAKENGYRQIIIAMTTPGKPSVYMCFAGLTISEKVRMLAFMNADVQAQDLGLVYRDDRDN